MAILQCVVNWSVTITKNWKDANSKNINLYSAKINFESAESIHFVPLSVYFDISKIQD